MARKRLTDRFLRTLGNAPPGKRTDHWDDLAIGLGARVNDKGAVSFVHMKRAPGAKQATRRSIGAYPSVSLQLARKIAGEWSSQIAEGHDPRVVAEQKRREEARRQETTFGAVCEAFIAEHVSRLRSKHEIARVLRREFVALWADRPVTDIQRSEVVRTMRQKASRGPTAARDAFAFLRKMFRWSLSQDYGLDRSPCSEISPGDLFGRPVTRSRIFTDAEWRALWHATEAMGYPWGPLYRLLSLTGLRLDEWASAQWPEIDLDRKLLTLAAGRVKNGSGRVIPLASKSASILANLPRFSGPYVFTTTGGLRPVSSFSKAKRRLDTRMGVDDWVTHDLRRSFRTGLSFLAVPDRVCEIAVGHSVTGLRKIYDMHRFTAEHLDAVEKWERHLLNVVEGRPANVVPLHTASA